MPFSHEPTNRLAATRPDIWQRGLTLATGITGYIYEPKLPGPGGVIWACGGGEITNRWHPAYPWPSRKAELDFWIPELEKEVERNKNWEDAPDYVKDAHREEAEKLKNMIIERREIEKSESGGKGPLGNSTVFVPEGAMEWLLHEVGHWLAASPEERALPNYGLGSVVDNHSELGYSREWQAWAFEEIIMAPFGPSRSFAPPTQRDGVAFTKSAIPPITLAHIEQRIRQDQIDVEQFRSVWGDWVVWGETFPYGDRPWISEA